MPPSEHYQRRRLHWRALHTQAAIEYRRFVRARLAVGLIAVVLAGLAFGPSLISAWWLLIPIAVFIALAIFHARVDAERSTASRAVDYYERSLSRLNNEWIGRGSSGERFRDPKHVYADDLDIFGRGSLFELLSNARTEAGERALAHWLLAPGEESAVIARQQSVAELRSRSDLREEFALIGDDIRAAVDAKILGEWGSAPPIIFFPGARILAPLLAAAALAAFALFFWHILSLRPCLVVALLEMLFVYFTRDSVRRVVASVSTPARDLNLLSVLLARLEHEPFQSARLIEIKRELSSSGRPASAEIKRLTRLVEQMQSANNQFFRPIASPLLWIPQFAMAIERWRETHGREIGRWTGAIGEFEALCSLAGFAYERPLATFPELLPQSEFLFEATAINHPLIPSEKSVANDVSIGNPIRLWIVSGSNMSGKSTLMRAVGLNAVLAWAGAAVTCDRLRISPLFIGASMRANDSVIDNRSRFYAEIERLRDVVNLARDGHPTLFLLDELLSGTNSHDRRIGAEALVRGLVARNAIGMVTTHDLALAKIADSLDGKAVNVHFEDHLERGEIKFDYRLHPGVVTRSNALELMRAVGLDV